MFRSRLRIVVLGLLGIVAVLGVAGAVALRSLDLRQLIERRASAALDRRLTIGGLRISWGTTLAVELTDLRLANPAWSSAADMLRIPRLAARIDLWPLLRGVLRYERLTIEQPTLLLERAADGAKNWHFKETGSAGPAIVPKNRSQFPTLLDVALHGGHLVLRAPGRRDLRLDFNELTIRSPGDDQRVSLALDGAYDGIPARLAGDTESFARLRDAAVPFGTKLTLSAAPATFGFDGTMTEPLDFEGVAGPLRLDAPKLGALLAAAGVDIPAAFPLRLAGAFDKHGDRWQLSGADGALGANPLKGKFGFVEGGPGEADAIELALDFARLDAATLMPADSAPGRPLEQRLWPQPEARPGATLDARIAAKQLILGKTTLGDFAVRGRLLPGRAAIDAISFAIAGGKLDATLSLQAAPRGSRLALEAGLVGADAAKLGALAGVADEVTGKIDGSAALAMTGESLADALRASNGAAVLAMTGGRVARALLEQASADLRALFRKGEGWVPISCLLGVATLRNGAARIAPLRLRTADTTVVGGGTVDLAGKRLDLTIEAEGAGTSILALEVPLHATGAFGAVSVHPEIGSADWLDTAARNDAVKELPPAQRGLAERNPCRQ